ncbi:MAG: ABC transporter permease subunit [Oscillospiraceae bacterium]|nr:ABC transporter permease subunit [Oscillospiraceae bacterium]
MIAVFKHELSSHFKGLSGYVFGAFLLAVMGLYVTDYHLLGLNVKFEEIVTAISYYAFLLAIPILTMRVLSEERRQKTDQLLYSLPISMTDVVLGKYLAMLVVFLIPVALMSLYPLVLSSYGEVNLKMAYCAIFTFYLLGASLIAMGTFVSTMTENQVASAGLCFIVMLVNLLLSPIASLFPSTAVASMVAIAVFVLLLAFLAYQLTKNATVALVIAVVLEAATLIAYMIKSSLFENLVPGILQKLSLYQHLANVSNGKFDIASVVYYISVIGVFLFLTVQTMEKRRWSE